MAAILEIANFFVLLSIMAWRASFLASRFIIYCLFNSLYFSGNSIMRTSSKQLLHKQDMSFSNSPGPSRPEQRKHGLAKVSIMFSAFASLRLMNCLIFTLLRKTAGLNSAVLILRSSFLAFSLLYPKSRTTNKCAHVLFRAFVRMLRRPLLHAKSALKFRIYFLNFKLLPSIIVFFQRYCIQEFPQIFSAQ